jgi:hypothetical protein
MARPSAAWQCEIRLQDQDWIGETDLLDPPVEGCLIPDSGPPPAGALGTSVAFLDSLPAAVRQAKERDQLLMVLNVSGDFDDSRFT